ncbi:hypothetical protein [Streptomyces sp. NPDC051561]|uniref:hypothetical protein n=1 Tax=Streptomyces sp. NPDC051561 TaxID=3365658 RepID=UPI0037B4A785
MTKPQSTGPAATPPHLFDEIQALLPPLRTLLRNHQERLDQHRDPEGYVIEDQQREYEDARWETALEASDTLAALLPRLEQLVADPPRRAFTLAVTGPAHGEADDIWLFIVEGTDVDDAWRALSALRIFRQWVELEFPSHHGVQDEPALVLSRSHAGFATPGTFTDLREDRVRGAAVRTPDPIAPTVPPLPPLSVGPHHSR